MEDYERLSAKLRKFKPSLTLHLKRQALERQALGLPVYDFGLGETRGELSPQDKAAGIRAFEDGRTMYGDPGGIPELRQAVLSWLGLEKVYSAENVVVTAGAKQALFNLFHAVLNPADAVLLDAAPWVSYQPMIAATYGFPILVLPLERGAAGRLKVTPGDLRRNLRLRPHARMFLLNNPVNPTGQSYTAEETAALLQVCVEHKVFFVLDRLYWKIYFDGARFPEPPLDAESLRWLVQVDGMSKNFRRTGGLRVGWSVAPLDIARAMTNLQSHYTAGPAVPTQHVALDALTRPYDISMLSELEGHRDLLREHAAGMPNVEVWDTPATFYSFWDVRGCVGKRTPKGLVLENSDDVASYLLGEGGVVTAAGSMFMQEGYLRLSFSTTADQIVDGMRAAREVLGRLSG